MKLPICVWLVVLASTGVANAMMPQIGCDGGDNGGLGGDDCGTWADALNALDGVSGVDCGGDYPFLYVDPRGATATTPTCEASASALNKLDGVANISCDAYYGYFTVPGADCPAVPVRLTAILQGPTCKHGDPISGPTGGENCTGYPNPSCDSGWKGSNCDLPVPRYVCNNSTYRCVPATAPGSGAFLTTCLKTCTKPPPPCHTDTDCGAHKICDTADNSCHCASGWGGVTCSVCVKRCSGRGSCPMSGVCECDTGYGGDDCSTFLDGSPLFNETQIVTQEWGALLNDWAKQPAGQKWALCYSSATMDKTTDEFHKRCDQYKPTVTVAHNSLGRTFGGFADETWKWSSGPYPNGGCSVDPKEPAACCTSSSTCYKGTSACFIFELGPDSGGPLRFGPIGTSTDYTLAHPERWPSWGSGDEPDLSMGEMGDPGDLGCCGAEARGSGTYAGVPGQFDAPLCGTPSIGSWGETQLEVWRQV